MTSSVDTNFFSYLLKEKTSLNQLDEEEEKEMWRIAQDFFYSGFLINSLSFNKLNSELLNMFYCLKRYGVEFRKNFFTRGQTT